MKPFTRNLKTMFFLLLFLLLLTGCSAGIKHPDNINKNIEFNKSIKLVTLTPLGPDASSVPKNFIDLDVYNLSGQDIKVSDKNIFLYRKEGNGFIQISNLTEGSFGGWTDIPAKNEFNQNGRLPLGIEPDIDVKRPNTIRVYVLGTMQDKLWGNKEVGAYVDIDIK